VDVFPPDQQQQVRVQLSVSLQGIVTQQLLPKADGQGRVVATEVLVPTPAVRNLIREGKTHQIYSALQTGGQFGMQTMDASLAQLVREHKITRELAEARSATPEELRRLMGTVRVA
jgi:twitching motility protein PilT